MSLFGRAHGRARTRGHDALPPALALQDFTALTAGAFTTFPGWLTFTRASGGYSVRTGTTTAIATGLTASDVGRIGRADDAYNLGLVFEPGTTNLCGAARDVSGSTWTTGGAVLTTTLNASAGPDGSVLADRSEVAAASQSNLVQVAALAAGTYTGSLWRKRVGGTANIHVMDLSTGGGAIAQSAPETVTNDLWAFKSVTMGPVGGPATHYMIPVCAFARGGSWAPAAARSFDTDLHQYEARKFATECAFGTRAAEKLVVPAGRAAALLRGGRLGFYVRFRAKCSLANCDANPWLLAWPPAAGDGGVFLDKANGYLYAYNGASESQTANSAITWAANDLVEIYCEVGGGTTLLRWRVNGGSWTTPAMSVRNNTFATLDLSSGLDLLQIGGTAHVASWVERLAFYQPGRGP